MRIAVYGGPGVGRETREGVEACLTDAGIPWQEIGPDDVPLLADGEFDAFYVPGGWAWEYIRCIAPAGKRAVRQLVAAGGSYIGVCAGAYFAADLIKWENRFVEYDLDLYGGLATGPVDAIAPWRGWKLTSLDLQGDHAVHAGTREPVGLYWGGPEFGPSRRDGETVLATYRATGRPAAVTFRYGQGQVLLMGCHLELGWDAEHQSFDLAGGHGAQWTWLQRAVRWTGAQGRR